MMDSAKHIYNADNLIYSIQEFAVKLQNWLWLTA